MTFAAREESRALGAPIALFLFTYGPNADDVYGYTSGEDLVTYIGVDFAPIPMHGGNAVASGTLDKTQLEVRMDKSVALVDLFNPWPPSFVVAMRIFTGHVGESEFILSWTGRVLSTKIEVDEAVITGEPISTSLRRNGLRQNYQYSCPHVLYGPACRASQAAATTNAVVQSVETPFIVLPNGWWGGVDLSLFKNGMVTWIDATNHQQIRSIVFQVSSTQIQLSGDCSTLVPGMTLSVIQGCDHLQTGCNAHGNIPNFGGQPWIPFKNPIGVVNNYD